MLNFDSQPIIFIDTSRDYKCGIDGELVFVDNKALKWAHSKLLRKHFNNIAFRQKTAERSLHS